jgi:hypothetical protein
MILITDGSPCALVIVVTPKTRHVTDLTAVSPADQRTMEHIPAELPHTKLDAHIPVINDEVDKVSEEILVISLT